jgi:hypothetical protein
LLHSFQNRPIKTVTAAEYADFAARATSSFYFLSSNRHLRWSSFFTRVMVSHIFRKVLLLTKSTSPMIVQ